MLAGAGEAVVSGAAEGAWGCSSGWRNRLTDGDNPGCHGRTRKATEDKTQTTGQQNNKDNQNNQSDKNDSNNKSSRNDKNKPQHQQQMC